MSCTCTEVFNKSIAIIDEISANGTITDAQVKEYKNRAPYLLDIWQKEMIKNGDLYKVAEFVSTNEDDLYKWTKYDLPQDIKLIKEIIFVNADSQISTIDYKRFGKSEIYFYFTQNGTVRLLYIPIPATITALTQTLEIDDITATSGAYYLAEHFALADQNTDLANICRGKFQELKMDSMVKSPLSPQEIKDFYGINQIK
jgi:hypothetical protein